MNNTALAEQLIRAVEEADSSARLLEAVQNMAAANLEETVPNLIAALGYNNPGAAVAAVDGLVQIGTPAVQQLLELIDNYNYGARAWAVRALAGIGDPRALETLLDAAKNDFALSVRRSAARGLGAIEWEKMPPSQVQPAQQQVLETLTQVCQDPEWVVRYAAIVGLEGLAQSVKDRPEMLQQITAQLEKVSKNDSETSVTTRVQVAFEQLQPLAINQNFIQTASREKGDQVPNRGGSRR